MIIPVGIVYFFLYFFIFKFLIKKFNLKTPGREDDDEETKLYTKADVNARKEAEKDGAAGQPSALSAMITKGLGGADNISDVDCCATRLRVTVKNADQVDEAVLKQSGAARVIKKGKGVQVIYGPRVSVIKSDLEEYLQNPVEVEETPVQAVVEEPAKEVKKEIKEIFVAPDKRRSKTDQ